MNGKINKMAFWSINLIDEANIKKVVEKHLEDVGYSWSNVADVSRKKGVDLILRKPFYGFFQIELKTLGNIQDYLFLEIFSVLEKKIAHWKPIKDTLYMFVRCKNGVFTERVIVIKGLNLQEIYNNFEYKHEEYIICPKCNISFYLSKIKFNDKSYIQRIQETNKCRYHSSCICIPLKEIKDFLG